ncbi:hypothetical protein AKJ63_00765, partial [candidate division MSBL1 archaeon SCGC-AAA259D18]
LADSSDPLDVAMAFQDLGLKELYVADLNAISFNGHNLDSIGDIISSTQLKVMIDGGFGRVREAKEYIDKGASKIVFATETLESFDEIYEIKNRYGVPLTASIDLDEREVIAKSQEILLPFPEIVQKFSDEEATEILILSLDRVGTSKGPAKEIIKEVLEWTELPLLVGGGTRNIDDIFQLEELGVSGVLIATALHEGTIDEGDIAALQ